MTMQAETIPRYQGSDIPGSPDGDVNETLKDGLWLDTLITAPVSALGRHVQVHIPPDQALALYWEIRRLMRNDRRGMLDERLGFREDVSA